MNYEKSEMREISQRIAIDLLEKKHHNQFNSDVEAFYSGDHIVYLAQAVSGLFLSIITNIVSCYIYDKLKNKFIKVKEVDGNIFEEYKTRVKQLEEEVNRLKKNDIKFRPRPDISHFEEYLNSHKQLSDDIKNLEKKAIEKLPK